MDEPFQNEKSPVSAAYYVTSGAVSQDSPSYVERRADKDLHHALLQGEFCYVLTSRQMGKSSLMVRTASSLRDQGFTTAILDLTEIGRNLAPEQWYFGLMLQLCRQLHLEEELPEFWSTHEQLSPVQRFFTAVRELAMMKRPGPLVIFVDELDAVRGLPFATDEFFAAIRECYSRRNQDPVLNRLTFCLLGIATPNDLIRDMRTTPFNVGIRIELDDFTEREAWPLAKGLDPNEEIAGALLARIFYWTHGHPYLTQQLCQAVRAAWPRVTDAKAARLRVDELCRNLFFANRARERDDNLVFIRDRILRSEADVATLLDFYSKLLGRNHRLKYDETNPLANILRLSGIASVAEGYLQIRNRIYERVFDRHWVQANTPNAELLRQRTAFWRGALRSAGLGIISLLALALLFQTAIKQSRTARMQADRSRQLDKEGLKLDLARGVDFQERGDSLEALFWFSEALAKDRDDPERIETERLRIGSILQQTPKVIQMWTGLPHVLYGQFGTNGSQVLLPGPDGRARLWDVVAGKPLSPPFGFSSGWDSASLSQDGQSVVTTDNTPVIRVWNVGTGNLTLALTNHSATYLAELNAKGDRILTVENDNGALIWNALTGVVVRRLSPDSGTVSAATFDHTGDRVVMAVDHQKAIVLEANTGNVLTVLEGHTGRIYDAKFSLDGRLIATASIDRTARVWDANKGTELFRVHHGDGIINVALSPDGQYLLTGGYDAEVRIWNIRSRDIKPRTLKQSGKVLCVAFSPDGSRILTATWNGVAQIWQIPEESKLPAPTELFFSPNGARCLLFTNGEVQVKQAFTMRTITSFEVTNRPVSSAEFNQDGSRFVTFSEPSPSSGQKRRIAQLWDSTTGQPLAAPFEYESELLNSSLSSEGDRLAIYGGNRASVLDTRTGHSICSIMVTNGMAENVRFDPRAERIVITSGRNARIWDVSSGRSLTPELAHDASVMHAEFSPDGRLLGTACSDTSLDAKAAYLWDAGTGKQATPPLAHRDGVFWVSFGPDSRKVVTASEDFTAIIWDAQSGRQLAPPLRHENQVSSAIFSANGLWIVTACLDGSARVWDAETGEPITPPLRDPGSELLSARFVANRRGILTVARESGIKRLWNLPQDNRPVDDLVLIADFLSQREGSYLNSVPATPHLLSNQTNSPKKTEKLRGSRPLSDSVLREIWLKLKAEYPNEFSATPAN